ncbi:MAG TPA: molybdopterin oxidoreductase family protein [Accumulibacter sp.]|uniref:molybdopterin-containing oxidoreductase family protein n=1 Tax=Accumulibacter sp. TaxID=2053492 RepID=UPI0025E5ACC7|nr:molybdopterin oxidoreductase family protein [Accumulibacter sp.]MCM8597880.1 molybdopterin oxidoreductase family protein [Accumulibacter sp.]MCM8663366.1 molybdopterin oxidoreductase family protein [Accumulibacter sp.]HNC50660.1 molybdopterin oxidoreductase family protein [Accumulibacter sp.]
MSNPVATHTVRAACPHDCPDTCALEVTVGDDRVVKVSGAADHPPTAGVLCTKVAYYPERIHHADRLLYPARRVGAKGPGARFERISWDEALATIARRFQRIVASDGAEAIVPYSYAGNSGLLGYGSMDRRFFHRLGASRLDRTICASAGALGYQATIGASVGLDPENVVDARLIILWGSNSVVSNLHFWRLVQEAKRRGARLIAIDPCRTVTADKCDQHIALLPGTDAALALGLMHVLIRDGLIDHDYIARHTLGFAALRERVLAYPPARVAAICGIDEVEVEGLAHAYGDTRPVAIRVNYGINRTAGGGMAVRSVACLPALVGAWRDPAGGVLLSTSGNYPVATAALEQPELMPEPMPRIVNMSRIGNDLLRARPAIKALFVYNSNPVAVAPHSAEVVEGFAREDLFTVVHDLFQTDTADYADILLPATSHMEQLDVHKSYGHLYLQVNQPAIAPLGEALPNTELFRRLARQMGFSEACFSDSDEDLCRQAFDWSDPRLAGLSWERLRADGHARLNLPRGAAPFAEGGFPTPSGKCEFHSSLLAQAGLDPLPNFIAPHEWRESELATEFPLALITPPARNFLNTSFANSARFLAQERSPALYLHPADAAARGIVDERRVRVFNRRGEFHARAVVTDRVRPGVAMSTSIWWRKLSPDGRNCNEVTSQALTDMGGGATFYDCLVEVADA